MKLLIADDNRNVRKILRSICNDFFDQIIECEDGSDAVEIYSRESPDLILMDIKMKKMDGIEATKILVSENPGAKVIIVSQFNEKIYVDAALKAGAVEYVNKENLRRIEEILRTKSYKKG